VRVLDAPKALVLYLDTELVRRQAEEAEADEAATGPVNIRATGAFMEDAQPADFTASWAFVLEPTTSGTTRLIERFRVRWQPSAARRQCELHAPLASALNLTFSQRPVLVLDDELLGFRDDRVAGLLQPLLDVTGRPSR
jgi:hypothetical protein